MRSVFLKEWRQGRLIVIFGLVLAGLIPALWYILSTVYVRGFRNQENVDLFCGILYYIVPLFLAVVVGSGIFAAELERGTLPLLLGLPFSRRAVWLGKLLAGLALTFSAIVLAFAPAVIARASVLEEVQFWLLAPDLLLWTIILFCIAFFWSTLCASIMSAVLATIVLWVSLVIATCFAIGILGARLLGAGVLLDAELWMLAACLALLVGSYVGFLRGELLQSRRRWLLPSATAVAATLLISFSLIGAIRWQTRYVRSQIERIGWQPSLTGGGSAVSLLTHGSPVNHRDFEARWFQLGESQHRSNHAVCVDLKTGKELLIRRDTNPPVVSTDGRFAAVLSGPRPLTWYDKQMQHPARTVEIWDLARHRLLYRSLPEEFTHPGPPNLSSAEWSPDGSWLALTTSSGWREWGGRATRRLMFMRPDGTQAHEVEVGERSNYWPSWDWDPSGQALYLLQDEGRLARHSLLDGKTETTWEATASQQLPPKFFVTHGEIAVSPDGRQVAVALVGYPYRGVGSERGVILAEYDRFFVLLVSSDGSHSQLIFKGHSDPDSGELGLHFTWSQDGKTLYVSTSVPVVRGSRTADRRTELVVWHEGAEAALLSALPDSPFDPETAILPDGRLLVSYGKHLWSIGPEGKLIPMPNEVRRSFVNSELLGLDQQGRAILVKRSKGGYIAAADLTTGELTTIYP